MKPIPLLVELCAGTAALSLRLHEEGARPPVSRMGAKTGYADIILERMGLVPGQTADAYLWCEPDPGVRLLLLAYTDATLARAAADVIRGWAKEDPRALWERLKAEGPVRAPEPREVARFVWHQGRVLHGTGFKASKAATVKRKTGRNLDQATREKIGSYIKQCRIEAGLTRRQVDAALGVRTACSWWEGRPKGVYPPKWPRYQQLKKLIGMDDRFDEQIKNISTIQVPIQNPGTWEVNVPGCADFSDRLDALPELPARIMPDASEVDPRELARWARILTSNRLVNPDPVTWTNTGDGGYRFGGEFADPVERLAEGWDLPELPAKVSPGAEAVDPREVARWVTLDSGNRLAPLFWSEKHKEYRTSGRYPGDERAVCFTDLWSTPSAEIVARLDDLPELPATVLAEAVEPPRLPEGSWVYIDPPYQGTTGYAHDLPREEVVRLARLWREAGAHVCISEAEPIPDLVAEGWHVVEITGDRKGQKRTFSKQKREFLTMSREPRGQLGFWGLS